MSRNKNKSNTEKIVEESKKEAFPHRKPSEEGVITASIQHDKDNGTAIKDSIKKVVTQLNIQILTSVTTTTLTLWWFLYNKITNFTGLESLNEQMCYIFVHYIDTITFILCLCLTAIKSYLLWNDVERDWLFKLYKLFLESWYWILGLCFLCIILEGSFSFEWIFFAAIMLIYLIMKMWDLGFKKKNIGVILFAVLLGFYLFIPSMTAIFKSVEIKTDKPFYSFSDKVYITVSVRGYACRHKLIGLGEEYRGSRYYSNKGLIVLDASQIKNNEIAIATISPVSGINFWGYTFRKVLGEAIKYKDINPNDIRAIRTYCDLTPQSIYVKP